MAYSYASRASLLSPDEIIDKAVVFEGPDRLDVLNVTDDGGIWLEVEGRVGIDAGSIIGVNPDKDDGFFSDLWKSLGRWGIGRLHTVTVDMSTIRLTPERDVQTTLALIDTPSITLPLTTNPPLDLSWLTTVAVPLFVAPNQNTSTLIEFARNSWQDGMVSIQAQLDELVVRGGSSDDNSWRRKIEQKKSNILTVIHVNGNSILYLIATAYPDPSHPVPDLPGLPPGRNSPSPDLSDFITLESFGVISQPETLSLYARVSIVDPAPPSLHLTLPTFPFTIHLPDDRNASASSLPVASVHTQPFSLTHPNITLLIAGTVLPILPTSTPILSNLLSNYLSGKPSPIIVTTPYLPSYAVEALFPAPKPKPKVLQNVTIENMKMLPKGTTFYASGTVYAKAVLPPGLKVTLDVDRILPDVLVFDGEVPEPAPQPIEFLWPWSPPTPPLPQPIPERAFARIRPNQWLYSLSKLDPEESDGCDVYTVTAKIVNAPLQVLPGRESVMSGFVQKVCCVSICSCNPEI